MTDTTETEPEFAVDLQADNSMRKGTLFITDLKALLRPATAWHRYNTDRDVYHAARVLDLGNEEGIYPIHLFTELDPAAAHKLLHEIVHAYCDVCNQEWWCDACILYYVGAVLKDTQDRYGTSDPDSNYQITIKVHCNTPANQVEGLIAALLEKITSEYYYVVRPDAEHGCVVTGFFQEFVDDGYPPSGYPPDDTIVD